MALVLPRVTDCGLRILQCGGESLGDIPRPTGYRLMNCYGPTEATIFVCATDVDEDYIPSSVGPAANNTKLYILDKERRRVR